MTRFTICDDEPEHGRLIGKYIKTESAMHVPETDIAEVVVYQSPQEMLDEAIEDTDIFILDIECGKSSGLDIAKEIRRLNKNAGIVFSIEQIYESIWEEEAIGADNTVAVHIRHIREKIEINPKEPRYLKVVWGVGYKIEKQP